jgi:hypothetical protein
MEKIYRLLLQLSKYRWIQILFTQSFIVRLQRQMKQKLLQPVKLSDMNFADRPLRGGSNRDIRRTYTPGILPTPLKSHKIRYSHNNRKATRGRKFRWQIITILSKSTGKVIEHRAIYHAA